MVHGADVRLEGVMHKKGGYRHNWTERHFRLQYVNVIGVGRQLELEYAKKVRRGAAVFRTVQGSIKLGHTVDGVGCEARPSQAPANRVKDFEIELITPERTWECTHHPEWQGWGADGRAGNGLSRGEMECRQWLDQEMGEEREWDKFK